MPRESDWPHESCKNSSSLAQISRVLFAHFISVEYKSIMCVCYVKEDIKGDKRVAINCTSYFYTQYFASPPKEGGGRRRHGVNNKSNNIIKFKELQTRTRERDDLKCT